MIYDVVRLNSWANALRLICPYRHNDWYLRTVSGDTLNDGGGLNIQFIGLGLFPKLNLHVISGNRLASSREPFYIEGFAMQRPIVNCGGLVISRAHALRGVSLLEFVGCLAAIVGGLISGVFYLGVDVKTAAQELLLKSELIEPMRLGVTSDDSRSQLNEKDSRQIGQSTDHNNTDHAPVSAESPTQIATQSSENPEPIPTPQFWSKLLQTTQQKPTAQQSNRKGQLYEYLTYQQQRHQQAVDTITHLGQPHAVDEKVLDYAAQALQWHHSGVNLFRQAAQQLTVTRASQWSGPFARGWKNAVTQHRMEEKLLLAKQQAVASYLGYPLRSHGPAR